MNTELPSHAVRYTMFFNSSHFCGKVGKKHGIAFTGNRKECAEFIKKSNDSIYHLMNNEYTRWKLRIVTVHSLSRFLKIWAIQFINL
jgi:NADH pyrophosphatase NudC (nudix superfamily)